MDLLGMSQGKIEEIEKKLFEEEIMRKRAEGRQIRGKWESIVYGRDVSGNELLRDVARDSRGFNPLWFVKSSWLQYTFEWGWGGVERELGQGEEDPVVVAAVTEEEAVETAEGMRVSTYHKDIRSDWRSVELQ